MPFIIFVRINGTRYSRIRYDAEIRDNRDDSLEPCGVAAFWVLHVFWTDDRTRPSLLRIYGILFVVFRLFFIRRIKWFVGRTTTQYRQLDFKQKRT